LSRERRSLYPTPLALALLFALMLIACGGGKDRRVAKLGDKVSVHYTGSLDSGEVFDSSAGREPLSFQVGHKDVIAGFDEAVLDMGVGDKKKVHIAPAQAYGEHRDDLLVKVPLKDAPPGLKAGDRVQLGNGSPATVVSVTDDTVTVDANHPLAGKALNFEIELVSIQ
jgi:FKBP-type peptidyl-prolyl cis-trans isomerase 2